MGGKSPKYWEKVKYYQAQTKTEYYEQTDRHYEHICILEILEANNIFP